MIDENKVMVSIPMAEYKRLIDQKQQASSPLEDYDEIIGGGVRLTRVGRRITMFVNEEQQIKSILKFVMDLK